MPLFRGATAVRNAVVNYLENMVPIVIDAARDDWDVDEYELPYPVAYDAYEPYALDQWPLIGVNVVQADTFRRINNIQALGGANEYLSKYLIRVYTWVRTPYDADELPLEPEYSQAIRLRDDLAACVRAALIGKSGSLGQPNAIIFDEASLSEEYSEATGVKGDRFVAGVMHSFEIRFDESVPLTIIGASDTIVLDTQTIAETEQEEDEAGS